MLKHRSNLVAVLLMSLAFLGFRTAPADFSGTWALNEGKSELGQFGSRGAPSKIVVAQKADAILITRTVMSFQGEASNYDENLTFDGKEVENTLFGAAKRKSTVKWAADQQSLTVNYSMVFGQGDRTFELKGTETWTVSADGKTLTVANTASTPQGEFSTKMVYDKQ
ncbi:MAG: hypothetical protein JO301_03770 [Chitinophagaceae bacterium]|nr:hypothetical protein [Chitinophagaceae bacterium]